MSFLPSLDERGFIVQKKQRLKKFKAPKCRKKRRKFKPQKVRNYHKYINSKRWERRRRRYYGRNPNVCKVCGAKDIQLHHLTYERLGNERDEDLIPLCRQHHSLFHEMLGGSRRKMEVETRTFIQAAQFDLEAEAVMRNI